MFFDISLFKLLPLLHTLYKHIIDVKATIDKQSPHAKLLLSKFGVLHRSKILLKLYALNENKFFCFNLC